MMEPERALATLELSPRMLDALVMLAGRDEPTTIHGSGIAYKTAYALVDRGLVVFWASYPNRVAITSRGYMSVSERLRQGEGGDDERSSDRKDTEWVLTS